MKAKLNGLKEYPYFNKDYVRQYDRCVPARQFNLEKDKHLYDLFSDDFNTPIIQEHSSNEAFYAPMRFQATVNRNFKSNQETIMSIDPSKEAIFFDDFRV